MPCISVKLDWLCHPSCFLFAFSICEVLHVQFPLQEEGNHLIISLKLFVRSAFNIDMAEFTVDYQYGPHVMVSRYAIRAVTLFCDIY